MYLEYSDAGSGSLGLHAVFDISEQPFPRVLLPSPRAGDEIGSRQRGRLCGEFGYRGWVHRKVQIYPDIFLCPRTIKAAKDSMRWPEGSKGCSECGVVSKALRYGPGMVGGCWVKAAGACSLHHARARQTLLIRPWGV